MARIHVNKAAIIFCVAIILLVVYYSHLNGALIWNKNYKKVLLRWYNYTNDDVKSISNIHIQQNDPKLIDTIRKHFLIEPPGKGEQLYVLEEPNIKDPSMGQSKKIINLLKNKTNGFFVECGALDGETRSNTLFFERYMNWKGLLIEADPSNFEQMLRRKRRAWLSPVCLSITDHPMIVPFEQKNNQGRISETTIEPSGAYKEGIVNVQCLPLYSLLLAINKTKIDYFSLDVEGHELQVLRTIPFDKVEIETLSVEFIHGKEGKDKIREFMLSKGYKVDSEVTDPNWLANDFIFYKDR